MMHIANNIWAVYLDTAFWLLLGLLAAGLIRSYISEHSMQRWVGGRGLAAVSRAALFGAPLPLCSCGVLPAAIGLHRAGASKEATVSFLISTPETSVDSVAVTYALMGPVMAVYRPLAALLNAIVTGMLTALVNHEAVAEAAKPIETTSCCGPAKASASPCCTGEATGGGDEAAACCNDDAKVTKPLSRPLQAMRYAGAELLDDISLWMAIGIVIAGLMLSFIPPGWLAQWGSGPAAMLIMLLVGIPMYICAVASTPVAAGLLLAGVSPGVVLVFLLVGPATNIASFALVKRELGLKVTVVYLLGISLMSVALGLLLDRMLAFMDWQVSARLGEAHTLLPFWLSLGSAVLLLLLAIRPLRKKLFPILT